MPFELKRGDAYLISFPGNPNAHLFVVITEIESTTGNFVMVGIESINKRSDLTVILKPGDHPFIKHESAITYRMASIRSLSWLEGFTNRKLASRKEPFTEEIIERVCKGFLRSPQTPNDVKDFFLNLTWKI